MDTVITAVEIIGSLLLVLIAAPVVFVIVWVACYVAFTRLALWCFRLAHVTRGRDLLIVYSNSPHWQPYVRQLEDALRRQAIDKMPAA